MFHTATSPQVSPPQRHPRDWPRCPRPSVHLPGQPQHCWNGSRWGQMAWNLGIWRLSFWRAKPCKTCKPWPKNEVLTFFEPQNESNAWGWGVLKPQHHNRCVMLTARQVRCIPCNKVVDDNHLSTGEGVNGTDTQLTAVHLNTCKSV